MRGGDNTGAAQRRKTLTNTVANTQTQPRTTPRNTPQTEQPGVPDRAGRRQRRRRPARAAVRRVLRHLARRREVCQRLQGGACRVCGLCLRADWMVCIFVVCADFVVGPRLLLVWTAFALERGAFFFACWLGRWRCLGRSSSSRLSHAPPPPYPTPKNHNTKKTTTPIPTEPQGDRGPRVQRLWHQLRELARADLRHAGDWTG